MSVVLRAVSERVSGCHCRWLLQVVSVRWRLAVHEKVAHGQLRACLPFVALVIVAAVVLSMMPDEKERPIPLLVRHLHRPDPVWCQTAD